MENLHKNNGKCFYIYYYNWIRGEPEPPQKAGVAKCVVDAWNNSLHCEQHNSESLTPVLPVLTEFSMVGVDTGR